MQSTWEQFPDLRGAVLRTRGNTAAAVQLVKQNLYVGEEVSLVVTCSIAELGAWNDGCLAVTNQRLFFAYTTVSTQSTYGSTIPLPPAPEFRELQGQVPVGGVRTFEIGRVPSHTVALTTAQYEALATAIDSVGYGEMSDSEAASGSAPAGPADPTDSLATAKRLLDLGLISQDEYDAKKQEILDRL